MYDEIVQYASIMYERNLKSFGDTVTAKDIISEVYAIGFSTKEDVIKIVRDVIFKEKRRLLAAQQQRISRNVPGEKICNRCKESKSYSEFYKRFDKRNGFRYFCNNCMDCEKIRRVEVNLRIRQKRDEKSRELVRYDLQY
jgi:hypothetical protein